jgi:hypothetical protein
MGTLRRLGFLLLDVLLSQAACGARTELTTSRQGDATSCARGLSLCGGYCVDEQTDANNCGACAGSCGPGTCNNGTCACPSTANDCPGEFANGRCLVTLAFGASVATDLHQINAVAVAGATAYWLSAVSSEGVRSISVCGGSPTVVSSVSEFAMPFTIAVDSTSVYWTNSLLSSLMKAPISGGTGTTLSSRGDGLGDFALAIDMHSAYWSDFSGTILTVPLSGGRTVPLISPGSDVVEGYPVIGSIVVDSTSIYWNWTTAHPTPPSPVGLLLKAPLTGGTPMTLATSPYSILGPLALDAKNIYWAETIGNAYQAGDGWVISVPLDGGSPNTLAVDTSIGAMTIDGESVYWTADDRVMKVPLNGGPVTTLASGQHNGTGIAVDATSVYWTVGPGFGYGGWLRKITPK